MPVAELPDNHSRPYYAEQLKSLYDPGEDYAIPYDLTAEKASVTADNNTSIEGVKGLWPFANQAAFEAALDALKVTVEANLDAYIADTVNAEETYQNILQDIKEDFEALVQAEGYTNICPACQNTGLDPTYNADGTLTGETIHSTTCDGYGYTLGSENAYTLDGNSKRFIQLP